MKIRAGRITAILSFLVLIVGAVMCFLSLAEDITNGRYLGHSERLFYERVFLVSYIFIILFILRYGYYLAVNRVNWKNIKDDFLYLLNKKLFSKTQWIINVILFWLTLLGFIFSLGISAMRGNF